MDDKPKLRKQLSQVLVPKDRVISSGRGCWNCKHWRPGEPAVTLWTEKRQTDLANAVRFAQESPHGENDVRVRNIRAMVDSLDQLVATKHAGICVGGGRTANGESVGDFVVHSFLCDRWSGVTGASLAHGDKPDPLPEERVEQMNGTPVSSPSSKKLN